MEQAKWTYDDILDIPHFEPRNHPRMSLLERAAQFSPFAALTGYDDVIRETARITEQRVDMDETRRNDINEALAEIADSPSGNLPVSIVYFRKDKTKEGGEYVSLHSSVRKLDLVGRTLTLMDGILIPLDDLLDLSIVRSESVRDEGDPR